MATLYSPTDVLIIGTKERIPGVALILEDTATLNADGTFEFDYEGYTTIDWDNQETISRAPKGQPAQRVFVDENGDEWLESELQLIEQTEEDEEARDAA